jgi:hypothetical protein
MHRFVAEVINKLRFTAPGCDILEAGIALKGTHQ